MDLHFLVYPFSDKHVTVIYVLFTVKDLSFGLELKYDDLLGSTYVLNIKDNVTSSDAKSFGDIKRSFQKPRGAYITHINNDPVFSTKQATEKLKYLYYKFLQDKDQGVVRKFSFDITFARKENL